jgi:hypothetical protein
LEADAALPGIRGDFMAWRRMQVASIHPKGFRVLEIYLRMCVSFSIRGGCVGFNASRRMCGEAREPTASGGGIPDLKAFRRMQVFLGIRGGQRSQPIPADVVQFKHTRRAGGDSMSPGR